MFSCSFKNVFQIISHPTSVNTGHRHKNVLSFHQTDCSDVFQAISRLILM